MEETHGCRGAGAGLSGDVTSSTRLRPASAGETHRCAQFLFHEAALLDAGDHAGWSKLLAPDVVYWVPLLSDYRDPEDELNIVYDDLSKINDRLERLAGGYAFAQDPPSRTTRIIGNVRAWQNGGGFTTESAFVLHELRPEATPVQTLAGRYLHELQTDSSEAGFAIRRKTIELVNRTESFGNLAFIL
jgi:3-phenylpropionate/cinnamic acid dioxygenase small subunit